MPVTYFQLKIYERQQLDRIYEFMTTPLRRTDGIQQKSQFEDFSRFLRNLIESNGCLNHQKYLTPRWNKQNKCHSQFWNVNIYDRPTQANGRHPTKFAIWRFFPLSAQFNRVQNGHAKQLKCLTPVERKKDTKQILPQNVNIYDHPIQANGRYPTKVAISWFFPFSAQFKSPEWTCWTTKVPPR